MQANSGKTIRPSGPALVGLLLGLAGALLDFYSGYQLLTQPGMEAAPEVWGVGLICLGFVLAITALASSNPAWARLAPDFGTLMSVYGLVMLFVGAIMLSGLTPLMQGGTAVGLGMAIVGVLMLVSGVRMSRSQRMRLSETMAARDTYNR